MVYRKSIVTVLLASLVVLSAAEETTPPTFEQLVARAQNVVQNVTAHVSHMLGLPEKDHKEVLSTVVNQTKALTIHIQDTVQQFHQAATSKDSVIYPLIAQLNETANKLQTAEFQQKSKQVQEAFTDSVTKMLEETKKLVQEVNKESQPNGNLEQIAKNAVDKTIAIAKNFQDKIHDVVGPHPPHEGHH